MTENRIGSLYFRACSPCLRADAWGCKEWYDVESWKNYMVLRMKMAICFSQFNEWYDIENENDDMLLRKQIMIGHENGGKIQTLGTIKPKNSMGSNSASPRDFRFVFAASLRNSELETPGISTGDWKLQERNNMTTHKTFWRTDGTPTMTGWLIEEKFAGTEGITASSHWHSRQGEMLDAMFPNGNYLYTILHSHYYIHVNVYWMTSILNLVAESQHSWA